MRPEFVIARREIKAMLREKSFALILLVELMLVTFSGLLNVGYVLLTSPAASEHLYNLNRFVNVGVVSGTPGAFAQSLDASNIPAVFYSDFGTAQGDFRNGLIDAILVGDLELSPNRTVLEVYLPQNSPKADLVKLGLQTLLLRLEDSMRRERIEAYRAKVQLLTFTFPANAAHKEVEIYYIFTLPLLLFLPSLIGGSLIIDSITEDVENKTIINLLSAPLTSRQIVAGKALGAVVICVMQSALWLAILNLLGLGIHNYALLLFVSFLYALLFIAMGAVTSLSLRNLRQSQMVHTAVSVASISLFSPAANLSPHLVSNSPSYIITGLAAGNDPVAFFPSLLALAVLAAVACGLALGLARNLEGV